MNSVKTIGYMTKVLYIHGVSSLELIDFYENWSEPTDNEAILFKIGLCKEVREWIKQDNLRNEIEVRRLFILLHREFLSRCFRS